MADIFLSYSRLDKERAEILADTFRSMGWSVWWDDQIASAERWEEVLEKELTKAKAVVVCWSEGASKSPWVQKEAEFAIQHNKYVPVSFDGSAPPGEFASIQATKLRNWRGALRWPGVSELLYVLAERIGGVEVQIQTVLDHYRTQRVIAVVWYLLSACAAVYAFSMWVASQTSGKAGACCVIETDPVKGSLIAIIFVGLLLLLANILLYLYASRNASEHWVARIPRLGFAKPSGDNLYTRMNKSLILTIFVLMPVASLVHFTGKVLEFGTVVRCSNKPVADIKIIDYWRTVPEFHELSGMVYCFGGDKSAAYHGIQFFPFYEPYFIVLLLALVFATFIRSMVAVLRAPR